MRKKNRECKMAKRDLQRQAIQSGNTKLEEKKSRSKETLRWKDRDKKKTKNRKTKNQMKKMTNVMIHYLQINKKNKELQQENGW